MQLLFTKGDNVIKPNSSRGWRSTKGDLNQLVHCNRPVRRGGNHDRIARPESFNIEVLKMKRDRYYTTLCDYADTLERLMEDDDGITFSFLDEMGDDISLQSLMAMDVECLGEVFVT
ncbi:hypothetical protein K443DRAFT_683604 [Laccaria amethystina LaAM-08-1]|uniref:Uncharacterized protein n=1 Tax=Laccaria amethystina LaAM-08-1 TaxID=1095629 RepID=A0A0C9XAA9_9AGAR|nr:hypothetical protein K443DRAFT_683604 [Laccaria amethystina LaAM-08-1]